MVSSSTLRTMMLAMVTVVSVVFLVQTISSTSSNDPVTPAVPRCPTCPSCDAPPVVPSLSDAAHVPVCKCKECPTPPSPEPCPVCHDSTPSPPASSPQSGAQARIMASPAEMAPDVGYLDGFAPKDPLNVIYFHSPFHWPWHLDHWLKGVPRPIRMYIDPSGKKCMHNSIVVVNHLSVKESKYDMDAYFRHCGSKGITKIGVFHTGDLELKQKYAYYSKAAFVYRNHFPSNAQMKAHHLPAEKVFILPLGSKFLETISLDNFYQTLPSTRRKHFCGFVGALAHSGSRKDMGQGLRAAGLIANTDTYKLMGTEGGFKCAVYFSSSNWNHKSQMKNYEYRALMSNTVFALVPLGRGPDSFRLYEALELGAIPIITDVDHFNVPLGQDHPLPRVKLSEWSSKPAQLLRKYYDDKEATFELQKKVFKWWVQWKHKFRQQMAANVEKLF